VEKKKAGKPASKRTTNFKTYSAAAVSSAGSAEIAVVSSDSTSPVALVFVPRRVFFSAFGSSPAPSPPIAVT
jgi:hypothetical protein